MMATKPRANLTQEEYILQRDERIVELSRREGFRAGDIAALMLREGTLQSRSKESAIHTVRVVLTKAREELNDERTGDAAPAVVSNEIDALERKLDRLRAEHARQMVIATGEPTENCARSGIAVVTCRNQDCIERGEHVPFVGPAIGMTMMTTPQGPMISYKALWPAGVRQKASKDAAGLAEKIADLEIALDTKRQATIESDATGAGEGGLTIVPSDKPIADLIKLNGVN